MTRQTTSSAPRTQGRRGAEQSTSSLHREYQQLRCQREQMVALVDYYYGAFRETRSLLERRERELADVRRRLDNKPIPLPR